MSNPRSLQPRRRNDRQAPRPFHTARSINLPTTRPLTPGRPSWRGRGPFFAPLVAALLLIAAAATTLYGMSLTSTSSASPDPGGAVRDGVTISGTIAIVRDGAVWGVTGDQIVQLTRGTTDGEIAWSRAGDWLYFIRQRDETGTRRNYDGSTTDLKMRVPTLFQIAVGGGAEESLLDGLVSQGGSLTNSAFIFDPAPGPGGSIYLSTDYRGPSGSGDIGSDVIIRYLQPSGRVLAPGFPDYAPFGQQDPAWNSAETQLYYVQNGSGAKDSVSRIVAYDVANTTTRLFSGRGFIEPAPSPDGRWIAATRLTTKGTDVVILDALSGNVVAEVTRNGRSWSPAWSPDGTSLAFLVPLGSRAALEIASVSTAGGVPTIAASVRVLRDPVDPGVRPAWGSRAASGLAPAVSPSP